MKLVALWASCLLAAAVLAVPAGPALAEEGLLSVTAAWPEDRLVDTHDVVTVAVTVDAPQLTTVSLEHSDTSTGPWQVAATTAVGPGARTVRLQVPTEVAGTIWTRVTASTDSVDAYASESYEWTVLDETLALSAVTLTAPGVSDVTLGRSVAVSGKVTGGGADRRVSLQLRTPRGWMTVRTPRTDATGRWQTSVPTDWYLRGTLRAAVPETATHRAATSATDFTMRVLPTYSPRGRSGLWSTLIASSVHRWNPCGTIRYRVNTKGAPRGALTWVRQAFRQVRQGTGLRFEYAGTTSAIPFRSDGGQAASTADFDVAWASPRQVAWLKGSTVGVGGFGAGGEEIAVGGVSLDRTARLRRGFGEGDSWGSLLLHEIGHAVGLGHVDAPSQVMNPYLSPRTAYRWGAGDLNGLRRLGATRGCFPGSDPVLGRRAPLTWVVSP